MLGWCFFFFFGAAAKGAYLYFLLCRRKLLITLLYLRTVSHLDAETEPYFLFLAQRFL